MCLGTLLKLISHFHGVHRQPNSTKLEDTRRRLRQCVQRVATAEIKPSRRSCFIAEVLELKSWYRIGHVMSSLWELVGLFVRALWSNFIDWHKLSYSYSSNTLEFHNSSYRNSLCFRFNCWCVDMVSQRDSILMLILLLITGRLLSVSCFDSPGKKKVEWSIQ